MKVVYLNPSGQMGGAEWSLVNLLSGLKERSDFAAHLVVPEEGPLISYSNQLGISTEILPFPREVEAMGDSRDGNVVLNRAHALIAVVRSLRPGCKYLAQLKSILKRERPDAIHTNGFKMHLAGALANHKQAGRRTPLVGHIHDYVSRRPVAGKALRSAAARFSRFVANSHSVAADIRSSLRTCKVEVIYNSIDTGRYSPEGNVIDLDCKCGLAKADPGTVRVGLVATYARWKGHITFLQAIAAIDPSIAIRGYVIGGPIYRTAGSQFTVEELRAEVMRLDMGNRVGFTGFIEDTAAAIRSLDIVVHASTKPEPFGMAIAEAMACGKAVVVSDAGGARELFDDQRTAIGHRPGNVIQLAEKITFLAQNPVLRTELGKRAARAICSRFQKPAIASNFYQVYEAVINEVAAAAT